MERWRAAAQRAGCSSQNVGAHGLWDSPFRMSAAPTRGGGGHAVWGTKLCTGSSTISPACVTLAKSRHPPGLFIFCKMRSRVLPPLWVVMRMEWDSRLKLPLRHRSMPTPRWMLVLPFLLCLNFLSGQWVHFSCGHFSLYVSLKPPFPKKK